MGGKYMKANWYWSDSRNVIEASYCGQYLQVYKQGSTWTYEIEGGAEGGWDSAEQAKTLAEAAAEKLMEISFKEQEEFYKYLSEREDFYETCKRGSDEDVADKEAAVEESEPECVPVPAASDEHTGR